MADMEVVPPVTPPVPRHYIIAVDPGLKNTCISLVEVNLHKLGPNSRLLYSKVGDLTGIPAPNVDSAKTFFNVAEIEIRCILRDLGNPPCHVVVEFQPPINHRKMVLIRWNSWIEGYALCFFQTGGWKVNYSFPSAVKRHFCIASTEYKTNKALSILKAKQLCDTPELIKQDHVADCILMAIYEALI